MPCLALCLLMVGNSFAFSRIWALSYLTLQLLDFALKIFLIYHSINFIHGLILKIGYFLFYVWWCTHHTSLHYSNNLQLSWFQHLFHLFLDFNCFLYQFLVWWLPFWYLFLLKLKFFLFIYAMVSFASFWLSSCFNEPIDSAQLLKLLFQSKIRTCCLSLNINRWNY